MGYGVSIDNNIDDNSRDLPLVEITANKVHDDFSRTLINNVHKLPIDFFRNKLIAHFNILFKQNKIRRSQSSSNK